MISPHLNRGAANSLNKGDSPTEQRGPEALPPMISYIVTSRNKPKKLMRLLDSIYRPANHMRHQVIVCAQSTEIAKLVENVYPQAKVVQIPASSLSAARNAGLPYVKGDYICFPDDDCYYPEGTVEATVREFEQCPRIDFVAGVAKDPDTGHIYHGLRHAAPVTQRNVWRAVISFNVIARTKLTSEIGLFDDRLGVGTAFGAAEESDYMIRALQAGFVGTSIPDFEVFHPDKDIHPERAFAYGRGTGAVYRKHITASRDYVFAAKAVFAVLAPLCRTIFDRCHRKQHWNTFLGRTSGFLRWPGYTK